MRHVRNIRTDAMPNVECTRPTGTVHCPGNYCPRHAPADYAETMARHSVDSLPAHLTREMHFHTYGITR